MSDTAILKVDGKSLNRLKLVMSLASRQTAKGYCVDDNRFILFWTNHEKMIPFPTELSLDQCAEMAMTWLDSKECDHGNCMDHDGDSEKGWICYHDEWGYIDGIGWQAFLAIKPFWQHYGK